MPEINELNLHIENLEREKQSKPKLRERNEIIKIKTEINKIQ